MMTRPRHGVIVAGLTVWASLSGPSCGQVPDVTGHKCFDPDSGNEISCDASGDSGNTIIMGPPQIIWVEPSARGSTMGTITDVDQKLLTQLRGIQDTAITLVTKGEFSMSHGDYRKAEAYFSVARERDPYNTNLQQDLIQLHQLELRAGGSGLFDAGTQGVTGTHFQPHRRLAVLPKSMLKEHENDPTVKELRLQEIAAYNGLAKADATLKLAQQGLGTGRSTQADVDRAQQAVDAAAQDFIRKQDKLKKRVHAVADNL